MSAQDEEDVYFSTNPPPRHLEAHAAQARAFIEAHAAAGRRVVLVTSGGTTVPLEKQTVRFIDNFSAGTRGATSAEYFLEAGYAVVFLHREFSLTPYARHFSHATTGGFLDFLEVGQDAANAAAAASPSGGVVRARPDVSAKMVDVLSRYHHARSENLLLSIPFVTIGDYLHELRAISRLMASLGPRGLLYLAAAVSDFFVPPERMAEHKIQSTDLGKRAAAAAAAASGGAPSGGDAAKQDSEEEEFDNFDSSPRVPRSKRLIIDLDPVPKLLLNLVDGWAPRGMVSSFKLETDPAILVTKARYSLDRYQHHLVIGNLLATRKWEVVFVSPGREDNWLRVQRKDKEWTEEDVRKLRQGEVPKEEPGEEIERFIIPAVKELHDQHIKANE